MPATRPGTAAAAAALTLMLASPASYANTKPRGVVMLKPAPVVADAPAVGTRILFLNRQGGTFTPGYDDDATTNVSGLVMTTSQISPFKHSDQAWREVVDCMRTTFAPFDLEVTDVDPGTSPHMEAVIAGNPSEIGESADVAGIALMYDDCSLAEGSITLTFANVMTDPNEICWTAAQEAAHAMGLDHSMDCADPMTYDMSCGSIKRFQDKDSQCGEYEARDCFCGGTQNSVQHLHNVLGASDSVEPDPVPPTDQEPDDSVPPSDAPPASEVSAACSSTGTSTGGSCAWLMAALALTLGLRNRRVLPAESNR